MSAAASRGTPVARAPGKLVLSGAYSVLWGAPCLVGAVDRYALAFRDEPHTHLAAEVAAAVSLGLLDRPCRVDVSALRATDASATSGSRKLGLGSSAAIVVATLAAARAELADERGAFPRAERDRLFRDALLAHRTAQEGGSGVDVAASVYGGVLACRVEAGGGLVVEPRPLPDGVEVHVVAARQPASTQGMVARVKAFEATSRARFAEILKEARAHAEAAALASSASALLAAMRGQDAALRALAAEADVPIFTRDFDHLAAAAAEEGAFFGPSGAGGGDVGIYVGERAPGAAVATALAELEVDRLAVHVGASGVHVERRPR